MDGVCDSSSVCELDARVVVWEQSACGGAQGRAVTASLQPSVSPSQPQNRA